MYPELGVGWIVDQMREEAGCLLVDPLLWGVLGVPIQLVSQPRNRL